MLTRRSMHERDALEKLARIHDDAQDLLARLDRAGHLEAAAFMSIAVDAIGRAVSDQRLAAREMRLHDLT